MLGTNATFTLEVKPPSGSFMVIQRTTPAAFNTVNELELTLRAVAA